MNFFPPAERSRRWVPRHHSPPALPWPTATRAAHPLLPAFKIINYHKEEHLLQLHNVKWLFNLSARLFSSIQSQAAALLCDESGSIPLVNMIRLGNTQTIHCQEEISSYKSWKTQKKWRIDFNKCYKQGIGRVGRGCHWLSLSNPLGWVSAFPNRTKPSIGRLGLLRCCFNVQFIQSNLASFGELQMNCYLLCVNKTLAFLA